MNRTLQNLHLQPLQMKILRGQERHLRHQKDLLRSRNTHIRELVMQRILSRERFQEQLLRP